MIKNNVKYNIIAGLLVSTLPAIAMDSDKGDKTSKKVLHFTCPSEAQINEAVAQDASTVVNMGITFSLKNSTDKNRNIPLKFQLLTVTMPSQPNGGAVCYYRQGDPQDSNTRMLYAIPKFETPMRYCSADINYYVDDMHDVNEVFKAKEPGEIMITCKE